MSLTPQDIHHKEFRSARFGGYNEEEVDSFLDLVADDFERMVHENTDINQQLELMRKRVAEFEEMQTSLQTALLAATRSAEDIMEQARLDSEATLTKAQEEADSHIRGAQEQARQIMLRAQNERQRLERDFARLREIKRRYMDSLRGVAEGHLREVEDLEAREEAEPVLDEALKTLDEPVTVREAAVERPPAGELSTARDYSVPVDRPKAELEPPVPDEVPLVGPPIGEPVPAGGVVEKEGPSETAKAVEPRGGQGEDGPARGQERPSGPPAVESAQEAAKQAPAPETKQAAAATAVTPEVEAEPVAREAVEPEERVHSSQLVDEVLLLENDENPYADYTGLDGESQESGPAGRRSKREKRDKHFFWE